jgi:hypothetical protein
MSGTACGVFTTIGPATVAPGCPDINSPLDVVVEHPVLVLVLVKESESSLRVAVEY